MVTKSGELRTYYQRDWETVLPWQTTLPKSPSWERVIQVAGLTLPFISLLYQPAGKAISLASTFLNVLFIGKTVHETRRQVGYLEGISQPFSRSEGIEHHTSGNFPIIERRKKLKLQNFANTLHCIKNCAEFIGTIASLRIGLAVHTVLNLGENLLLALWEFKKISVSEIPDKMFPVVSNALYLLTLVNFSTPVSYGVIGTSLVFQIAWYFSKAIRDFTSLMEPPKFQKGIEVPRDINALRDKKIQLAAHLGMAVIYLREVMRVHEAAWPLWQKQNAS